MIGTTVSHYKILEKLGQGGMGVVYKAEDLTLKRIVALKFLPPHVSASETDRARFLLEAQAAAALNHPNICTIYGIEDTGEHSFIAMEFVDGQTLRDKRDAINLAKAIDIGIQISDGLAVAHEKGIVHRDIKPENIMVRKDGIVQIMDFGLAKLRASRASRLTKEGSTVGTAGYMSPEQVQGQETDHRSDIFSLGVLLYELFTGELPFKGIHETALLYEIVNVDPAPMSTVKPEIDAELDRIVLECLQKDPDERYQGVKDISKDLKRFKRESSKQRLSRTIPARQYASSAGAGSAQAQPAAPVPAPLRYLWPVLCCVLAAALIFALWGPWRSSAPPDAASLRIPLRLPDNTNLAPSTIALAVSPRGDRFAYIASTGGAQQMFLRSLDQFDAVPVPGTDGASDPFFSPDGQWIAYFTNSKLLKISVSGGTPVEICSVSGFPRGGWWDADGRIWFGNINQSIVRIPANGGAPAAVTVLDSANREISHRFPCVLPDGKTIIYTVKQDNITTFDDAIIMAENTESHQRTVLVRGGTFGRYVPPGYLLFARGDMLYAAAFDAGTLSLGGTPQAVLTGGMVNPFSGLANFGVSDNGTLIYSPLGAFGDQKQTLFWLTPDGATASVLDSVRQYGPIGLSPDGERLVMTIRAANDDIWVYHMVRKTLSKLTFGGGNSDLPVWSPDGKTVLFATERKGSFVYLLKPWDGSGEVREVAPGFSAEPTSIPSFTPDGQRILTSSHGDLWSLPVDGSAAPTRLTQSPANESWPSVSPDGRWLAYASDESGRMEVYVVPFPHGSGKWQISSTGGVYPIWLNGGRTLFFYSGNTIMSTPITLSPSFDFGAPKKLYTIPANFNGQSLIFTPDGAKAIIALGITKNVPATQLNIAMGWIRELQRKLSHDQAQ
jgi:serine/threonine protein kinase